MKTWIIRLPYASLDPRTFSSASWLTDSRTLRTALAAEGFTVNPHAVWPDYAARTISFMVSHRSDSAVTWYTLKYPDTLYEFIEV